MKNHFKRLLSLVMALLMVAALLPVSALAEEITWTEVDTYEEFKAALDNGGNIRLTASFTGTDQYEVTKPAVIDFNGNTYTPYNGKFWGFMISSTVTLKDSSATGEGGMTVTAPKASTQQLIRVGGSGVLTIESGSYSIVQNYSASKASDSNGNALYSWGNTTVLGGTFTATGKITGDIRAVNNASSGKLTIKGGSFSANNTGDGAAYGIRIESNKSATITVPADANAVTITAHAANASAYGFENKGVLNIYSDKLNVTATTEASGTADKYAYGISNARTVNVSGGTFKAYATTEDATKTQAMGFNNTRVDTSVVGTGTISGGSFYASAPGNRGSGIVTAYANNLVITGDAEFSGTGRGFYAYRGTSTISGGTFSSANASYCVEITKDSNVTITDGDFNVTKEKHIRNAGTLSISGGTFNSIIKTISNSGTLTITGGNFVGTSGKGMVDVYSHLDTTKYSQKNDGSIVAAGTEAPRFSVTIGDTTTEYESVVSAIAAASADTTGNAKLTLLRDITLGASPATTTTMEIDLGGHTWLNYNNMNIDVGGLGTEKKITKIHNGTVINTGSSVPLAVKNGAMQLENLTVYGCSTMPVCYYAATGEYTADNYIKNCNLITNRYYVFSYRSESEAGQQDMDMLIENTNLINLYGKTGGGEIFFTGAKASTGKITLGENVNIYQLADTTNLARQANQTPAVVQPAYAEGYTLADRVDPQQYADVNAILAKIGEATGFQEGAYVYKQESVWTTAPSLYKTSTVEALEDTTVATIGDTEYASVTEALDAAEEGETVVLQKDINVNEDLIVIEDVTLNLNGKNVTAGSLTVFGALVDGNKGGKALIIADNFHVVGGYLPIYDSAKGGYRVFKYEVVNMGTRAAGENAAKFGFRLTLDNADGYALLATGESKLKLTASVSWTGTNNNKFDYPFKDATVKAYGEALVSDRTNATIVLTVSGLDILGENGTFTMTPNFATTVGMNAVGTSSTWTAANA